MTIKDQTLTKGSSLKEALKKMSLSGNKCLVVTDQKNKFLGTLSDGDLRKAILADFDLDSSITKIFNPNAFYILKEELNLETLKDIFIEKQFDVIPIINKNNSIHKIISWNEVFASKPKKLSLDLPIVIMAGGKGSRLEPFTNVLPKPLIPINDSKTVIEHIIGNFLDSGFYDYYISINFKGKILKAYFEELNPEYSVSFIEENKPLGTAGALRNLIGKINSTFLVTNCDVVVYADHSDLLNFHKKNECKLTLVASTKEIVIPYGACSLDKKGYLKEILEKPSLNYLINSGLYVIEPSAIELIPSNKSYDMTDLIEKMLSNGEKVGVFPIDDDSWIDLGQWEQYRDAIKRLG